MKIIRFLSEEGRVLLGRYEDSHPGEALVISGDPLKEFHVGTDRAVIRQLLPPLVPCTILAVGLNYRRHAEETGMAFPSVPVVFMKAATSIIGHGEAILLPLAGPHRVDYEAELAVIIGKKGKNISRDAAMDHVFGYACANDITAREWQTEKQSGQWVRAKSFDTFCPFGPFLVTRDEIPDPGKLRIRTIVNGNVLQDGNTADMIFDLPSLISDISRSLTLLPGTMIMTGTPEGVGYTRRPPVYLRDGDEVTIEIEGIGTLTNPVRRETA